jgi:hypothetical protein
MATLPGGRGVPVAELANRAHKSSGSATASRATRWRATGDGRRSTTVSDGASAAVEASMAHGSTQRQPGRWPGRALRPRWTSLGVLERAEDAKRCQGQGQGPVTLGTWALRTGLSPTLHPLPTPSPRPSPLPQPPPTFFIHKAPAVCSSCPLFTGLTSSLSFTSTPP